LRKIPSGFEEGEKYSWIRGALSVDLLKVFLNPKEWFPYEGCAVCQLGSKTRQYVHDMSTSQSSCGIATQESIF